MTKTIFVLLLAVMVCGCANNQQQQQPEVEVATDADTVQPAEVPAPAPQPEKQLVVGYQEWDIYFTDWKPGYTLNYEGSPLSDRDAGAPTRIYLRDGHERMFTLALQGWSHVKSLALEESKYRVGKFNARRSVAPDGTIGYDFETHGAGIGVIADLTMLKAEYEDWLVSNFSSTTDPAMDSLISLVSCPFPLQIPQPVQKIGITFRMEPYHDGSFPRTKVWMRLTNFSSLDTNETIIADVTGTVENMTDGKPTLSEGESLMLKNFYGGLGTQWFLTHEGDRLALYEQTEDEPTPDAAQGNAAGKKELLALTIPQALAFSFCGYFPMGE